MHSIVVMAVLAVFALQALPARADWDVKAKLTCYEFNVGKIERMRGSNSDLIAACLGVEPEDPSVANHALTYDSNARELRVLRRGDCVEICGFSTQLGCQEAVSETSSQIKSKRTCIDELHDIGPVEVEGSMICSESESLSLSTGKESFKASCKGNLIGDTLPCELSFSTGKEICEEI